MDGKTCLVTGANRGIGKATAEQLARQGARVIMLGRDASALAAARADVVASSGNENVETLVCDLSSQAEVRRACAALPRLDLLVNNAVVIRGKRHVTVDGLEETLAVNHLAPFLMTSLLLPRMRGGRVVQVTTGAFPKSIDWDDLQLEKSYDAFAAYVQAKMLNLAWALDLGRRAAETGVTVNAVLPAPFVRTEGTRELPAGFRFFLAALGPFKLSPEKAAARVVHIATSSDLARVSGEMFVKGKPGGEPALARDADVIAKTRAQSARLVGWSDPA